MRRFRRKRENIDRKIAEINEWLFEFHQDILSIFSKLAEIENRLDANQQWLDSFESRLKKVEYYFSSQECEMNE